MPSTPPTPPRRTEATDIQPAPHRDGNQLPMVDPITMKIMISDFDLTFPPSRQVRPLALIALQRGLQP